MTQPIPTSSESAKAHTFSDLDSSTVAQHHTLGLDANKASPGNHTHNGANSKRIGAKLDPAFPVTAGAVYTQAQIQSLINALRDLGFGT